MNTEEKKGVAKGAVLGAVLGVIIGILFAPKSGKETRQDIKDTAKKAADKIRQEAIDAKDDLKELIASFEPKLKELKGKTLDVAKEKMSDAKKQYDNLTDVLKAFKAGEASDKDLDKAIKQANASKDALKKYLAK